MVENDLKDWVRKELVSNMDLAEKILSEHKEKIRNLVSIKDDGKVVVNKSDLSAKQLIGLYLIGAAYAKIADLRTDDSVPNKEILEQLKMKEGTVKSQLKALRDEGMAIQKGSGLHHINYKKINNLVDEITP